MPGVTDPKYQVETVALQMLKVKLIDTELGAFIQDHLALRRVAPWEALDGLLEDAAVELSSKVLAEQIGGERIAKSETVEHTFIVIDGSFQRWKERHKESWWLGWLVRRRPVRHIVRSVQQEVTLTVDVTDYATFPRANYREPPDVFGAPVFRRMISSRIQ